MAFVLGLARLGGGANSGMVIAGSGPGEIRGNHSPKRCGEVLCRGALKARP